MKEVVKQVILSHKRAKKVDTTKTIAGCSICVPEAQADEYREYNPDVDIIVHPDSVIGLTPKIRWVYEQFKNVIMFDDDLNAMRRTFVDKEFDEGFQIKDPELARDIVQSTAFTAREAGCVFFGFSNSARPLDYNPMKPVKFSGYGVGGSHGFLDGYKMVIPDSVIAGQDYFLSATNAHFHRKAYINTRYAFTSKDGTLSPREV